MAEELLRIKDDKVKRVLEELISKDWSKMKPDEGLQHLKVTAENIGNIPGMVTHWQGEIRKRKREISEWKQRSFISKAAEMLGRNQQLAPESVTGEDMTKYHRSAKAAELIEKLRKEPQDYTSRLGLVSLVGKSDKELAIEVYRTLLLQASVAHCFGEFSTQGLQVALWAQNMYFNKLIQKCRADLQNIRDKMSDPKSLFAHHRGVMLNIQGHIEKNIRILNAYQIHANKAAVETKYHLNSTFHLEEILTFQKMREEKQETQVKYAQKDGKEQQAEIQLFAKTNAVIHFLRYLVLLHPVAHEIADKLIKANPESPLGHFLKGRIHMSELVFTIQKFQAGEQSKEVIVQIQERFKETYHQYGIAATKTDTNRGAGGRAKMTDVTIVQEYAGALHYFYHISKTVLRVKLPRPWLFDNIRKARTLLMHTHTNERRTIELIQLLEEIMDQEELASPTPVKAQPEETNTEAPATDQPTE